MTPTELINTARRRYNAESDTFFTEQECLDYIYEAELELALEAFAIQKTYSVATVSGTQAYAWPTTTFAIVRATFDGNKLAPICMREDDVVTMQNTTTATTGTPSYYYSWEKTLYLRPIPGSAGTLKIWTLDIPQTPTIASTLEIPVEFHMDLTYPMLAGMAAKDKDSRLSEYYRGMWESRKLRAKRSLRERLRRDAPGHVKDIDFINQSGIGNV